MIKGALIEKTERFKTLTTTNKSHKKILFAAESKGRTGTGSLSEDLCLLQFTITTSVPPVLDFFKGATLVKIHFTGVF